MYIETFTGKHFTLETAEFDIIDIAHALSLECRFAGHCQRFYSVAEHCCHVHDLLIPFDLAKHGLLHDASEAYIRDIPRPFKPALPDYIALEGLIQGRVEQYFNCPTTEFNSARILWADREMFDREAKILLKSGNKYFGKFFSAIRMFSFEIKCWSPRRAEKEFLKRFKLCND